MVSLSSILQNNPLIKFREPDRLYYSQFSTKLVFADKDLCYFNTRLFVTGKESYWIQRDWSPVEFKEPVKFRQESGQFAIFVNNKASAERLIDHVNKYRNLLNSNNIEEYLIAVEFPLTNEREQHLANDKIFRGKKFGFRYRVAVADGLVKYHAPAVKELLKSLDEEYGNFQISKDMLRRLRFNSYMYNNHYYCNDLGHITWIRLLDPKFIKKIQEVVRKA